MSNWFTCKIMTIIYQLTIFPLLCLISVLGISQNIVIDLQWGNEQVVVNGDTSYISNCSYCRLDEGLHPTVVYSITEEIDSVWIDKVESEYLLGYDISGYKELKINVDNVESGDKTITNLSIPAIFVEEGRLKKIKSLIVGYTKPLVGYDNNLSRSKKTANYTSSSKLSTGTWYKLEIKNDGIYKLDAAYLASLGITTSSLEGKKVRIFGSGNAMLPQVNDEFRYDDLVENAIYVSTTKMFSSDDYVLFYGESPHKIISDTANKTLSHKINLYTNSSYYFLNVDGDDGLRVGLQDVSGAATKTLRTSDEYVYIEEEKNNTLHSGRSWYGNHFDTYDQHVYSLATPGKINNSEFRYQSAVMARAYVSEVSFSTTLNGTLTATQSIPKNAVNSSAYGITGYDKVDDYVLDFSDYDNSNSFEVKISFVGDANSNRNDGIQTHGYINYFGLQYHRDLAGTDKQYVFRNFESLKQSLSKYELSINSSYSVWNVSDPLHPEIVMLTGEGDKYSFIEDSDLFNQYVLFSNTGYLVPSSALQINNQNLHGVSLVPDMVIITHEAVKGKAQEYADYRSHTGLTYLLVTPEEIYNEFSSGGQDISAIRDFLKMLYDRSPEGLKYAVLFGGASYDYKDVIENNTNNVPIYQSRESLHNIQTYSSDDYYGFLSDGDGEWAETSAGNHQMVISIGRILARTNEEAETLVNKIIHYETSSDAVGEWRSYLALMADDGDGNLHVNDANKLSDIIDEKYPYVKVDKLYLDDYEQVPTDNGWGKSPAYDDAYDRMIDRGALMVNYTGHGAPFQLAEEAMMTVPRVNAMTNYNQLPVYVTATCEVGRFEDPTVTSSVIFSLLYNKLGGAIATITTTRPVFASSNYRINEAFYNNVFQKGSDDEFLTLGEVFMRTKNESVSNVYNRNFSLLGDPCLKINLPENKVLLTVMNQEVINAESDTLKALSEVDFEGVVTDGSENILSDFDGILHVTVYDKEVDKKTLGSVDRSYAYKEWSNSLFDGLVSVESGVFHIRFTVPKDISYEYELGKINMYAVNSDSTVDAIGYYANLAIGGTDPFAKVNGEAPLADLFMDDESFVYGGFTGATTLFIAELYDDNGINLSSIGIGHEITLVIDEDRNNPIVLNNYYTSGLDEFQSGRVEYELKNLIEGVHHLKLTAWDTHNNPVVEELEFVVGTNITFYTYPNPFIEQTTLFIDHGGVGEEVVVDVAVVDDKGRIMFRESYPFQEAPNVIDNIVWDGTFNGTRAHAGIYFMKVNLYYPGSNTSISKIHKVVLLH